MAKWIKVHVRVEASPRAVVLQALVIGAPHAYGSWPEDPGKSRVLLTGGAIRNPLDQVNYREALREAWRRAISAFLGERAALTGGLIPRSRPSFVVRAVNLAVDTFLRQTKPDSWPVLTGMGQDQTIGREERYRIWFDRDEALGLNKDRLPDNAEIPRTRITVGIEPQPRGFLR